MTLYDLWCLIRHYWKAIVFIPVVCSLITGSFFMLNHHDQYKATSSVVPIELSGKIASSNLASVVLLLAQEYVSEHGYTGVALSRTDGKTSTDTSSIGIAVTGTDPEQCVEEANEICSGVVKRAEEYYSAIEDDFLSSVIDATSTNGLASGEITDFVIIDSVQDMGSNSRYYIFYASDAMSAEVIKDSSTKWIIIVLFGTFLIVVCILVILDLIRRPISRSRLVVETSELPLLNGFTKTNDADDVWANLRFAAGVNLETICLMPLSFVSIGDEGDRLVEAIRSSGQEAVIRRKDVCSGDSPSLQTDSRKIEIVECPPVSQSISGMYEAINASATIVYAREWKDTDDSLRRTLREFELAKIRPVGLVLSK